MRHLARPLLVAAVVACAQLVAGCGPTWPGVRAVGEPDFLRGHVPVRSVDVLPVDVAINVAPGVNLSPEDVAGRFDHVTLAALRAGLTERNYRVAAEIDRAGMTSSPGGAPAQVYSPEEVDATLRSLATFGAAQAKSPTLLFPYLPVRLGAATGAETTLYVGGSGLAAASEQSGKTARTVFIVLFVVIAVAIVIAALAKSNSGHGGGGHGGAGGQAVSAGAHVARGVGHVARAVGETLIEGTAHLILDASRPDAFGHAHTHLALGVVADEPPASGDSCTLLEMTLVDNLTGRVLWHSRQRFPASPASADDTRRAVESLLATLPTQ